ncbi:hypothetical protein WMY93_025040 [Mugilogobius chulae]|uniref:AAA+ ATPase domain-containing protein n=1 Tax=Mugilogobius chulae TaxID=88201 RepID=A0AAW0N188_9GOBI
MWRFPFLLNEIMSQRTYNQLWADAQSELTQLLAAELPPEPLRPEKDRVVFFQRLAVLYVRYLQVFRDLEVAYDQVVHPQKRVVIRANLDGVIGRLLELKNEMVEKEFSEYHYMDDVLHDLKLTPEDLEIPIPQHFIGEWGKDVRERKEMVSKILQTIKISECPQLDMVKEMSHEDAVKLIQVVERARQGRLRAKLNQESKKYRNQIDRDKHPQVADMEAAAVCIQKVWKSHAQRKRTKIDREQEEILLGMVIDPKYYSTLPSETTARENEIHTRTIQQEHEEDYQKCIVAITNQLRDVEAHDISQTMKDQIRQWFFECRDATGTFPDYPEDEEGGSALIFTEKSPQQLMEEIAAKEEEEANAKPKGKEEKGKRTREEEAGLKMLPSAFLADLVVGNKMYDEKKRLQEWKEEKKEKDLTADRTLGSLCQELVDQGLLKQPHNVKMQDFLGDYSYLGTTLRQNDIEPMPSLSDVRQVLSLYAILPLGSQFVHEKAPLIKAILLAGPAGVGKKMLVHAVCQETGANLFDLSPLNTAGKYPGKSGIAMMLHMVFKVARLLQPSVIWIGDAEKMFYKKVPKEEKDLDPKRLKKDLPKALKLIKGEDRVLIIGTTNDPLSADIKGLCKMYSKIILIPRPDYGSRFILWKQLIEKHGGKLTKDLNLSSLSKISDGYTPGHIVKVIQTVITKRRILQMSKKPLTALEFVEPLAKFDPVFQEEEEALKSWYAKTPLGKKRIKAATGQDEEEASAKPVKGKDTKKKGK